MIPKFIELLSVFSFETCSLTYSFKVSFLIALLINSPVNFISNFLGLAVLFILVTIFSLLIPFKCMLIAYTWLFFPALIIFYYSAFFSLKLPFGNYDSCTKHSTTKTSQARNLCIFFRIMLLQAPWYIVPYQGP